ncbi:unnamed protein product [Cladocopium goreaui]|uniref:Uncharacterized protein n=1 Tax=Cladocopium goreaui TaxID=2562237 RepID=A0A9P1CX11_9DINO|nr:unnamed protein product [Cladocopium goreaui]
MGGPRSLEAPWDRLDFQDQQAIEAYCSDLERILSMSNDGQSFAEHVAAMDQRFQEAWFTAKFGDPNADPMQAYRTPPTAGVVHPRQSSGSSISAQGSEILQRHASLLEGRFARPHAVPAAAGPPPREVSVPREVREAREAREAGSGAFTRNLASAAGPSSDELSWTSACCDMPAKQYQQLLQGLDVRISSAAAATAAHQWHRMSPSAVIVATKWRQQTGAPLGPGHRHRVFERGFGLVPELLQANSLHWGLGW